MSNRGIILVAEDSPADTILLKRAFARAGIGSAAIFFEDGEKLIEDLKARPSKAELNEGGLPALIMVDLAMPRVGGLEVLSWIRQQPKISKTPVIVFSGLNRPVDISRAYALGADLFLIKTSDPNQWTAVLRRLGEIYGLYEEQDKPAELTFSALAGNKAA